MAMNKELLGPKEGEEEVFSVEALVFSVQVALQKAMAEKGVSNKELASRLGMSPARVSQIFSEKGPNLTLNTIARVAYALEEEFEFSLKSEIKKRVLPKQSAKKFTCVVFGNAKQKTTTQWREVSANTSGRKVDMVA